MMKLTLGKQLDERRETDKEKILKKEIRNFIEVAIKNDDTDVNYARDVWIHWTFSGEDIFRKKQALAYWLTTWLLKEEELKVIVSYVPTLKSGETLCISW